MNSRSSSLKCRVAESANVTTGKASRARAGMGCRVDGFTEVDYFRIRAAIDRAERTAGVERRRVA